MLAFELDHEKVIGSADVDIRLFADRFDLLIGRKERGKGKQPRIRQLSIEAAPPLPHFLLKTRRTTHFDLVWVKVEVTRLGDSENERRQGLACLEVHCHGRHVCRIEVDGRKER